MTHTETMIKIIYANICAMSVPDILANSRRLSKLVKALCDMIKLAKLERRNAMKAAMLKCDKWRGRVLFELGGERALARWDARRMRALAPRPPAPPRPYFEVPKSPARFKGFGGRSVDPNTYYDRITVDQSGQFCLAPIKGHRIYKPKTEEIYVNPYGLKVKYTNIDPIALYPDELRGRAEPRPAVHTNAMRSLYETAARASAFAESLPKLAATPMPEPAPVGTARASP